jgi:beta-aspartyl-peptidase (threonine type)
LPSIIVHGGAGEYDPGEKQDHGVTASAEAGWNVLESGGSAVDAVEAAIVVMEDDPTFRAGYGSSLTFTGQIETDASIMAGDLSCGAVGAMTAVANPIRAARLVMERTDHILLVGPGADEFARRMGLPSRDLRTSERRELHARLREEFCEGQEIKFMPRLRELGWVTELGTVGAAAVDAGGRVAAGTSTGGIMMKLPGRVGDSALIGAGTYANGSGAVSATGHGEPIIRHLLCKSAADAIPHMGVREALSMVVELGGRQGARFGIVGVEENGAVAYGFNTRAMAWASIVDGASETFPY